jgi:tRNA G18 (ribose-2'-O)-methylase SpoU
MDNRNLIDHYKYWTDDAIRTHLDDKRHNFSVVCCNIGNDFNIATIIRNSNAFLAKEVVIYGNKKYDRRGTVGTHHYTNFRHVKSIDDLGSYVEETISKYEGKVKLLGIDNVCEAKDINSYDFDPDIHYVMIFGQEQIGVPANVLSMCDDLLYIPQYGSVRSINVGTASGIIMNNYCATLNDQKDDIFSVKVFCE